MKLEKYFGIVEYLNLGMEAVAKVSDMQKQLIDDQVKEAFKAIRSTIDDIFEGVEIRVKDWTVKDLRDYLDAALKDDKVSSTEICVVVSAYEKTHEEEKTCGTPDDALQSENAWVSLIKSLTRC